MHHLCEAMHSGRAPYFLEAERKAVDRVCCYRATIRRRGKPPALLFFKEIAGFAQVLWWVFVHEHNKNTLSPTVQALCSNLPGLFPCRAGKPLAPANADGSAFRRRKPSRT